MNAAEAKERHDWLRAVEEMGKQAERIRLLVEALREIVGETDYDCRASYDNTCAGCGYYRDNEHAPDCSVVRARSLLSTGGTHE